MIGRGLKSQLVDISAFTKRSTVTVSQLVDDRSKLRHAEFRANGAYDEQIPLLLLPGEKELIAKGRTHLLLAHGHQKAMKVYYFAMPNPKKPRLPGRPANLMTEIHDISANLTPVEGPKETPTIKQLTSKSN